MQKTFRIVIVVLLLLFSFSFCAAAQERWERVPTSAPSLEVFIDKRSLIFETDNNRYSKTYNHKFVTAWVAYDDYQKNITMQTYAKYNLTNSSYKLLAAYKYTLDGEVIDYYTIPAASYAFIPPDSNGDCILATLWVYWNMHRDGLI